MQIALRARNRPAAPGSGPTIWERYKVDGDGDGRTDTFDPADAIFTAARILRVVLRAPPAGGSYAAYRQAACNYYGACADDRRLRRRSDGAGASPTASDRAAASRAPSLGGGCAASVGAGTGPLGAVRKAFAPRHLEALPAGVAAGPGIRCDARIVPDVVYLARRFGVLVTACYSPSGHEATGEHPLGAAIDAVPRDGDWSRTARLARAVGWKPSCAASGVAPECARPPFRFVGYNGYPNHGDPLHCVPCAGGPHLHLSWLTSASPGEPESRARFSLRTGELDRGVRDGGPRRIPGPTRRPAWLSAPARAGTREGLP